MQRRPCGEWAWGSIVACVAAAAAMAADPPPARTSAPRTRVIGTQQIDRYAAIARLQDTVKTNPQSLADWIILGELAHEVGEDSPADQAARYFAISRDAYEKALALAPGKPGLKAAVQFARDYEIGAKRFTTIRDRATTTYLDARRRDLAATGYVPALRVSPSVPFPAVAPDAASVAPLVPAVGPAAASATLTVPPGGPREATAPLPPDAAPAVTPAPTHAASTDIANFGVRQIFAYPYPTYYRPYSAGEGTPYTFQQYSSAYSPPNLDTDAGEVPVTLQRYMIQEKVDENRRTVNPAYGPTTPAVPPIHP